MEKYLIILVIIFILYYIYTCYSNDKKEGFADAQTVDGVDESNSINTLAKIAKDIMDGGGLKVKGDAVISKALRVTGAKSTPAGSGDMITHFNHDDGNNYIRGNTYINGSLYTSGGVGVTSNLDVTNSTNEGGRISIMNGLKNGKAGQTNQWALWNMTGPYGNKLSFWRYNGDGANVGPAMDLNDDGKVVIPGSLDIGGKLTFGGKPAMMVRDYPGGRYVGKDTGVGGDYQAAFGWVAAGGCWEQYRTQLYFEGTWKFHAWNARYGDGGCSVVDNIRVYFFHNNLFNF